ncbi:MAG: FHA domain-containing protein [Proteobacteria bacterium]|nr:FHA domain-containing protein [Pseudomonadota bacterium]MCP4916991.1 FHA domain-containing protein [Pseudomonadota bacterium]
MEKAELLKSFNEKLNEYAELRGFIDKAKAQSGKFSAATIEKVVMKNETRSSDIADELRPMVNDLQAVIADLTSEVDAVNSKKANADEEMEELELRKIIGELSDKQFKKEAKAFKTELDEAEGRLTGLTEELESYQGALDQFVEAATAADHDTGSAAEAEVIEEPEVVEAGEDGVHIESGGLVEDVSAVFADPDESASAAVAVMPDSDEAEISIEAGEAEDEDEDAVDVDFGFESDGEEIDILDDDGVDEVEIDLVGGDDEDEDDMGLGDDDGPKVELSAPKISADDLEPGDARRALLIYQEGTAEEQIYPFTGDVLTIGRGRDNDIQIKNDSKVSRYHCKVFRRGDNFYIEDNKSSNGSLVNGELITERRLFGGEEVIIGETFFRFRIMD